MKLYRQGDILFRAISQVPDGKPTKRQDGVVMRSEATGHKHAVANLEAAEVLEISDGLYIQVSAEGGVSIVHDEHAEITLPRGDYEVIRQREYSPQEIRSVID